MIYLRITPIHFNLLKASLYVSSYDNLDFREGHSLHGTSSVFIDSYSKQFWKERKKTHSLSKLLFYYAKYVMRPVSSLYMWVVVYSAHKVSLKFVYDRILPVFGTIYAEEVFVIPIIEDRDTHAGITTKYGDIVPSYRRIIDLTPSIDHYIEKGTTSIPELASILGAKSFNDTLKTLSLLSELRKDKKVSFIGEYCTYEKNTV